MTNIAKLIVAAFRILADMDVRPNDDGTFTIIDIAMNGESDPIADIRDVAFIVASYIRQDVATIDAAGFDLLAKLDEASKGGAAEVASRPTASFGKTYR